MTLSSRYLLIFQTSFSFFTISLADFSSKSVREMLGDKSNVGNGFVSLRLGIVPTFRRNED